MPDSKLKAQIEVDPQRLEHPALAFLRSYWENKRAGRTLPTRTDMKPSELRPYLDSLTMVDVIDGGEEFRYRLVGTAVTQYFLFDPTGMTTAEAWPAEVGDIAAHARSNLRSIMTLRRPVRVRGTLNWPSFPTEPFDALYLPFSDDGETVTMIVNLFTFDRRNVLPARQVARQNGRTNLLAG